MKRVMVLCMVICLVVLASMASAETVTVMHWRSDSVNEYNALFAEFTKANPSIKVETQMLGDWQSAFKTRRAANELADIIMMGAGGELTETAQGGFLADLSKESFMKRVNAAALEGLQVDNKSYLLPLIAQNATPLYNEDIFAKFNIKVPTNWDEMLAVCDKLKTAGVTPVAWELGDAYNTTFASWDIFGGVVGKDANPMSYRIFKGDSTFSKEPGFLKAVDKMLTFAKKGYIPEGAEGMNIEQAFSYFGTGKAAMFFGGAWHYGALTRANPSLNIKPFVMASNDKGFATIIDAQMEGFSLNSKATSAAAARKVMDWLATPQIAAKYLMMAGGSASPITGATSYIPDTRATKTIRTMGAYVSQMASIRFDQQDFVPQAFGQDVQSRIFDVIREVMVKKGTAQDVADELDAMLPEVK